MTYHQVRRLHDSELVAQELHLRLVSNAPSTPPTISAGLSTVSLTNLNQILAFPTYDVRVKAARSPTPSRERASHEAQTGHNDREGVPRGVPFIRPAHLNRWLKILSFLGHP